MAYLVFVTYTALSYDIASLTRSLTLATATSIVVTQGLSVRMGPVSA